MAKMQKTEDIGGFKPIPEGVRDLEVRSVKPERKSQSSENYLANVGFVVVGGPHPGRWVWDRFMTSGNGIGRAAALYTAIFEKSPTDGIRIGATIDPYEWLKACEGHVVNTEVVLGTQQDGSRRNYVGGSNGKGDGGGFKFAKSALDKGGSSATAPRRKAAPPSKKR